MIDWMMEKKIRVCTIVVVVAQLCHQGYLSLGLETTDLQQKVQTEGRDCLTKDAVALWEV